MECGYNQMYVNEEIKTIHFKYANNCNHYILLFVTVSYMFIFILLYLYEYIYNKYTIFLFIRMVNHIYIYAWR